MDSTQERKINEAAEEFAEAVKDSYEAMANRAVNAQEMNAQLTQAFFNSVQSNLQAQAKGNQDLIEQQKKQQEASREMIQQSMNAYTDFLNSMFLYQQRALEMAHQQRVSKMAHDKKAPPQENSKGIMSLLEEWETEESGYDEETLPELKEALNRNRPSGRKLFVE